MMSTYRFEIVLLLIGVCGTPASWCACYHQFLSSRFIAVLAGYSC